MGPAGEGPSRGSSPWFQSLGRDSVGWDRSISAWKLPASAFQSLGRDSVGWDMLQRLDGGPDGGVSIPRSGFCGVGLCWPICGGRRRTCFNPSVGILWGGTRLSEGQDAPGARFQSLGRDSVGWDFIAEMEYTRGKQFQSLGRDSVGWDLCAMGGSQSCWRFQSLGRDSVGWDSSHPRGRGARFRFRLNPCIGQSEPDHSRFPSFHASSPPPPLFLRGVDTFMGG